MPRSPRWTRCGLLRVRFNGLLPLSLIVSERARLATRRTGRQAAPRVTRFRAARDTNHSPGDVVELADDLDVPVEQEAPAYQERVVVILLGTFARDLPACINGAITDLHLLRLPECINDTPLRLTDLNLFEAAAIPPFSYNARADHGGRHEDNHENYQRHVSISSHHNRRGLTPGISGRAAPLQKDESLRVRAPLHAVVRLRGEAKHLFRRFLQP